LKDVLFVVLPGTLLLDLAGPAEAFRLANQQRVKRGHKPLYRLRFIGPAAHSTSSVGAVLSQIEALPATLPRDALVVLLGQPSGAESPLQRPLSRAWTDTRRWLARVVAPHLLAPQAGAADALAPPTLSAREAPPQVKLMMVCAGALLAADAGLLGTRACTTHHEMLMDLQNLAPQAKVLANRIFVVDGAVASSAGITAGIDLTLHLIALDAGEALAAAVAQVMVVYVRRGPDEPELSPLLTGRQHLHAAIHRVQNAVGEKPAEDWSLQAMAQVAHVTPRHLSRLFEQHVGTTPRDYLQSVRVALAERALAQGQTPKRAWAEAGIGGARQWRRLRARSAQNNAESFANKSRGKSPGG
jgi:transcriptional regulator GlxA family with amidase domain